MTRLPATITETLRQDVELISIENQFAHAEISLFGGQVTAYSPVIDKRRNLLWVSPNSFWDKSRPVRGGIPVCWPWFGQAQDPALPAHGFVRNMMWTLINLLEEDHATTLLLSPESTSGPGFDKSTELELRISVGRELTLTLTTRNNGSEPVPITCALHTYFSISDISQIELKGLSGTYSDKTREWSIHETPRPYLFSEETDRIHQLPSPEIVIFDNEFVRHTSIRSAGHDSIVVWNPWDSAASLPDMDADSFRSMLCVETAVTKELKIKPGSIHHLVQVIGTSA